jgi:hypothetical protein
MLNVGQLAEVVWIVSDRPIQAAQPLPVVQAATNHIDPHYTP